VGPAAGPPHELAGPVHLRRGGFWLPGDLQDDADGPWQLGPAWVQWEAPAELTGRPPMVFVHGGGGQSTDWLGTTGAPRGWADLAVEDGHPSYLLDRPGHGRSPWDPARLGPKTAAPDYRGLEAVFVPRGGARAAAHTAWPWERTPGTPQVDAQVASSGGMLTDTALGHALDARRLVDLLHRTGPAVVVVHSAGAPAGWLAADRRPDLVLGLVAVEPLGPPHRDLGARGALTDGLTAVPLTWDRSAGRTALPTLARVPICVISAAASGRAPDDARTVQFLRDAGVGVDHLQLADHGMSGNGHGLVFEHDNHRAFAVVARWTRGHIGVLTTEEKR
jgi:pimeloyl-ACP methyl ester carboxylesterase